MGQVIPTFGAVLVAHVLSCSPYKYSEYYSYSSFVSLLQEMSTQLPYAAAPHALHCEPKLQKVFQVEKSIPVKKVYSRGHVVITDSPLPICKPNSFFGLFVCFCFLFCCSLFFGLLKLRPLSPSTLIVNWQPACRHVNVTDPPPGGQECNWLVRKRRNPILWHHLMTVTSHSFWRYVIPKQQWLT